MPIWLGGAGRSDEELARILNETVKDSRNRNRRMHERFALDDAKGELIFKGANSPCKVLEISLGGCSVETDKPFRPGVLAPVDVVVPLLGMILHIGGVTQWMKKDCHIGIRFTHVSFKSKNQLGALIECINGQNTPQAVIDLIASPVLNPTKGEVLAPQPAPAKAAEESAPKVSRPYDREVHRGEGRLRAQGKDEWPVVFRSPDDRFNLVGAIVDISLGGCTVQTIKPFVGEVQDHVEVDFDMQGLHFQMSGVAQAIYSPECVGIQFSPMSRRRREDLAILIEELCAANKTELEVA
jgi:hypothetical protein